MAGQFTINVEVIVVRNDRVLLIERGASEPHGAGWLSFPGGTVEADGSTTDLFEATAIRELAEEVGLTLDAPPRYVESHTFLIGDEVIVDVVMLGTTSGDAVIASPDEVAAIAWLTDAEMRSDLRVQPWTLASLTLARERHPASFE